MTTPEYISATLLKRKMYIERNYDVKVVFIGVFGSQNYGLDDSNSDLDTIAVYIPSLENLVVGKHEIKTLNMGENGCGEGQCKYMDVRDFADGLAKGSFTHLEVLATQYRICEPEFTVFLDDYGMIFNRYRWRLQNAVYGAINNLRKQIDLGADRKNKRVYEALRLINLYGQIVNPEVARPVFRIYPLAELCDIGYIKSGAAGADLEPYLDEIDDVVKNDAPPKEEPCIVEMYSGYDVREIANEVVKESVYKECSKMKSNPA